MSRPRSPGVVVAVVGATAVGKSDLALDLAERLDGEIVNADAMQLYRGMDIGTAKTPPQHRRGIPHHQLDVLDVTQEASVATYQTHARSDVDGIVRRGHLPVLVGGSGLYVRAALDVLDIPPTNPQVRARLEREALEQGPSAVYERLARLDPVAAQRIQPNNMRRVVRALEVIELTGRPFSASMPQRELLRPTVLLGLRRDREELDRRIEARARLMWDEGLAQETAGLLERGLRAGVTASRAIGYSQATAVLDGGLAAVEAVADIARATRRLSRRQDSWFGADPRIQWLDAAEPGLLDRALSIVADGVQAQRPGAGARE